MMGFFCCCITPTTTKTSIIIIIIKTAYNTCVLLQAHTDERPRRVPDFEAQDIAALGYEVCVCFSLSSF